MGYLRVIWDMSKRSIKVFVADNTSVFSEKFARSYAIRSTIGHV
jgi:hypothetical protein